MRGYLVGSGGGLGPLGVTLGLGGRAEADACIHVADAPFTTITVDDAPATAITVRDAPFTTITVDEEVC